MDAKRVEKIYYAISFFYMFPMALFFIGYVLFLAENGMSDSNIGIINGMFMLGVCLLEIPTGVIADAFGRKLSVILGLFAYALSYFVYYLGHTLGGFILAELISSFGYCFMSGALDAWLKDSHAFYHGKKYYGKIMTNGFYWKRVGMMLGGLTGAVLMISGKRWVWLISSIVQLAAALVFCKLMTEEYFVKSKFTFKLAKEKVKLIVHNSFHFTWNTLIIRKLAILSGISFFACQALNMQWTKLFSSIWGESYLWIGYFSFNVCMLGAILIAKNFVKPEKERLMLTVGALISGVFLSALLINQSIPMIVVAFLAYEVGRGIFQPVYSAYLQHHVPSDIRATVTSATSIVEHLGMGMGWWLSGVVVSSWGIVNVWMVSGLIFMITFVMTFWIPKNHIVKE